MAQCNDCDARIKYPGDGSQRNYTFPFEYTKTSEIRVSVYDEEKLKYVSLEHGTDWRLINATTVQLKEASLTPLVIYRCTDLSHMEATFHPGHSVKADDLNDDFNQLKFAIEESRCGIESINDELLDNKSIYLNRIKAGTDEDGLEGDLVKSNSDLLIDDDHVASTQWIDNRYWDQCDETTETNDRWVDEIDNGHVPTTGAVEQRLAEVVNNAINSIEVPEIPVTSVNDQTGDVSLGLGDLTDVETSTSGHIPSDGQALVWDAGMNHWMPGSVAADSGIPEAPSDGKQYGRQNDSWTEIVSTGGGGGAVDSVNGKTGVVVLTASDVGALGANDTAVDSDKLGGVPAEDYALKAELADVWTFRGILDPTTENPPANPETGDIYASDVAGTALASWNVTADGEPNLKPISNVEVGSLIGRGYNQWAVIGDANAEVVQDLQSVLDKGNVASLGATFGSGNITLGADGESKFGNAANSAKVIITSGTISGTITPKFALDDATGTRNVEILGTGSASFAGAVIVTNNPANGQEVGNYIQNGKYIASADNGNSVFDGWDKTNTVKTIQLNADGSGTFNGTIQVGDGYTNPIGSGKHGGVFSEEGFVIARRSDDINYVWQGYGVSSPQPTSTINADGTATFASYIDVGTFNTSQSDVGGSRVQGGIVKIQRPGSTAAGASALEVWKGTTNTVTIAADGAAEFAGGNTNIYASGSIEVGGNPNVSGTTAISAADTGTLTTRSSIPASIRVYPQTGTNPSIDLNRDGSGTFAGNVDVGDWPNTGSRRTSSGAILLNRSDAQTSEVFIGRFNGTDTSRINADGSADFSGVISTGGASSSGMGASGGRMRHTGDISLRKDGGTAAVVEVFQNGDGTADKKVIINNDGSASFANGNANISSAGVIYVSRDTGTQQIFGGGFGGDNTKFQAFASGAATFAGTVTAAGYSMANLAQL